MHKKRPEQQSDIYFWEVRSDVGSDTIQYYPISSNTIQFTTTQRFNVFCLTALFINGPPSGPECFWVPPHWCLDCKWYTDIFPFSFTFFFHIFVFALFPRNAFVNCIKVHNNKTLIHHLASLTNIKEHLKFNLCKKLCCLFQSAPSIARMCDKKCQRQNRPGKTNHLPEITFGWKFEEKLERKKGPRQRDKVWIFKITCIDPDMLSLSLSISWRFLVPKS